MDTGMDANADASCSSTAHPPAQHILSQVKGCKENKDKRKKWSWSEDELLICAWLNTSKTDKINTNQPSTASWKRIEQYYMENKVESAVPRAAIQCKSRWHKICKGVSKFVKCYELASQNKQNGQSSTDIFIAAKTIYSNSGSGKKFIYEDAWRKLKNEFKWMATYCESYNGGGSSKRTKTNEDGGYSGSCPAIPHIDGNDSTPLIRPPVIEECKKREKQVQNEACNSSSGDEYESNGEFSESLNQHANAKAQSLKQESGKIHALLKAKKLDKMAKKFDKETRELEVSSKKMDMLMMLMSRGENLSVEEQMLKSKLVREMLRE